jgi:hypothetical protein
MVCCEKPDNAVNRKLASKRFFMVYDLKLQGTSSPAYYGQGLVTRMTKYAKPKPMVCGIVIFRRSPEIEISLLFAFIIERVRKEFHNSCKPFLVIL